MSHSSDSGAKYSIRYSSNAPRGDPDIPENITYRITPEPEISEEQWRVCASMFSEHYGVWSVNAHLALGPRARPGNRIAMSVARLQAQSLPQGANNILVAATTGEGQHIGHCFVSQWRHEGHRVWWITQLVVHAAYRNQKKATRMLHALAKHYHIGADAEQRDRVGVLSSHPFAICAVLRVFGRGIKSLPSLNDRTPSQQDAPHMPLEGRVCVDILRGSPVDYVRTSRLLPDWLSAHTGFYVDHTEPKEALQSLSNSINRADQEPRQWYFGTLHEGHEYLCILDYRAAPKVIAGSDLGNQTLTPADTGSGDDAPRKPTERKSASRETAPSAETNDPSPINYVEIVTYLVQCASQHPSVVRSLRDGHYRAVDSLVNEAKELLARESQRVELEMMVQRVPEDLQEAYWHVRNIWRDSSPQPSPNGPVRWCQLQSLAADSFRPDAVQALRVAEAIHYLQLFKERDERSESDEPREHNEIENRDRPEENSSDTTETQPQPAADDMSWPGTDTRRVSSSASSSTIVAPDTPDTVLRQEQEDIKWQEWSAARWSRLREGAEERIENAHRVELDVSDTQESPSILLGNENTFAKETSNAYGIDGVETSHASENTESPSTASEENSSPENTTSPDPASQPTIPPTPEATPTNASLSPLFNDAETWDLFMRQKGRYESV